MKPNGEPTPEIECLLTAAESFGLAGWTSDPNTDARWWSPQLRRLLGVPPSVEPSIPLFEASMHPDDVEVRRRVIYDAVECDGTGWACGLRLRDPSGGWRELCERGRVERDAFGLPKRIVGSILEVPSQVSPSGHGTRVDRVQNVARLVGGIAHDFNNMLTVILGYLDLLAEDMPRSVVNNAVATMREAAEHGADLAASLLAYAHQQEFHRVDTPRAETVKAGEDEPRDLDGRESVLVVEDDPLIQKLVGTILRKHGYSVLTASSGEQALELLGGEEDGGIDMLLTDLVLPGISGATLAREVRARFPRVLVIYSSGYTERPFEPPGAYRRGVAFIRKPYLPVELLRQVRKMLDEAPATAT